MVGIMWDHGGSRVIMGGIRVDHEGVLGYHGGSWVGSWGIMGGIMGGIMIVILGGILDGIMGGVLGDILDDMVDSSYNSCPSSVTTVGGLNRRGVGPVPHL